MTGRAQKNGTICLVPTQSFQMEYIYKVQVYRDLKFDFVVGDGVIIEYSHFWARKDLIDAALAGKLVSILSI
jgi:hypothetical protein